MQPLTYSCKSSLDIYVFVVVGIKVFWVVCLYFLRDINQFTSPWLDMNWVKSEKTYMHVHVHVCSPT